MKNLILLRGVPGAGKSTTADAITDIKSGILSADMFFEDENGNYNFDGSKLRQAHQWCQDQVKDRMKWGKTPIVVANTFTRAWEMEEYFKLAGEYGYMVHSLIVENRHDGENVHSVPAEKVQEMKDRFEVKL